jgi:primosomal protein N' (replication factor Y)
VLDHVDDSPALIVSTPGAEPRADAGYAAALLLDGRVLLDRPELDAAQQAVHRWLAAVALVKPVSEGGTVVLVADPALVPVQAVLRNDPLGFSDRELVDRSAAHLPPIYRVAELTGAAADLTDLIAVAALPAGAQVLGPVPTTGRRATAQAMRTLVVVPSEDGGKLATALKAATAIRSARRDGAPVNVRIDPVALA